MAELKQIASQIRRDIVRMVHGASSGHPGGSLGCTDFFTALYFKVMKHDPAFNMNATGKMYSFYRTDIYLQFFIPPSHAAVILK